MFNPLVLNPAVAGTAESVSMVLLSRSQWLGFEGAPATQTFSIHGPVSQKMGLGLHVINDDIGPFQNTGILTSIAYKMPLASGKLSVGIRGGLLRYGVDWNKIEYLSGTPAIQDNKNTFFSPTFDLGLHYYTDKFYFGTAISHLFRSRVNLDRHFIATSGYELIISKSVVFKPSVLLKYVKNSPVNLDINTNFLFNDRFWLGAGVRLNYGAIFLTGFKIADKLNIGYSYDASFNKTRNYVGGSHEIFIGFDLKKKRFDIKLHLVTKDGIIIMTATMNNEGYFYFDNLPSDKSYIFLLESEEPRLINEIQVGSVNKDNQKEIITVSKSEDGLFRYTHLPYRETKLYAINEKRDTVMLAIRNKDGFFVFKLLPDDPNYAFFLESDDDTSLVDEVTVLINGKSVKLKRGEDNFFRYVKLPVEDVRLFLIDVNGDTLSEGVLNDDGFFVFRKLSPDNSYIFLLNAIDAELIDEVQVMYIDDDGAKVIITATKGGGKFFRYEYLEYKETKLHIINEDGDTLMTSLKNKDGFFLFKKLPSNQNYIFLLEDKDAAIIDDILILLTDESGKETLITATSAKGGSAFGGKETVNRFRYHYLPESEIGKPGLVDEKDVPVILEREEEKIVNTVFESLKFNTGEAIIKYESYPYFEELSDLLIKKPEWKIRLSGHTDDVGSERFNLLLSKRRAEAVKRALVKRGVQPKRIIVEYYGETQSVADNSSEEGRQKNRRVQMLIVKKKN